MYKIVTNITNYSLFVVWIALSDPLQYVDFQFGSFSVFLQVLNDLQSNSTSSPVCENTVFKSNKCITSCCILIKLSLLDEESYLLWSKHCTTFPKVPSPKVSTISSVRQIEKEAGVCFFFSVRRLPPSNWTDTYICLRGRPRCCRSDDHSQCPSRWGLQPRRSSAGHKNNSIYDRWSIICAEINLLNAVTSDLCVLKGKGHQLYLPLHSNLDADTKQTLSWSW